MNVWHEDMNDHFHKVHIVGLGVQHIFSGADGPDAEFHDHPWDFTTKIMHGGYIEEVVNPETLEVVTIERREGDFVSWQNPVHRIIRLTAPFCITLADYGAPRGWEASFFRFDAYGRLLERKHGSDQWNCV